MQMMPKAGFATIAGGGFGAQHRNATIQKVENGFIVQIVAERTVRHQVDPAQLAVMRHQMQNLDGIEADAVDAMLEEDLSHTIPSEETYIARTFEEAVELMSAYFTDGVPPDVAH